MGVKGNINKYSNKSYYMEEEGEKNTSGIKIILIIAAVIIVGGVIFVIFIASAGESIITRKISSTTVGPSGEIEVNLIVKLKGDETFYAIEEYIPTGWTVIDGGKGITSDSDKLAWVVIQDAQNTAYTYTVQAPSSAGSYLFDGIYQFEGATVPSTTSGNTNVVVS